MALGDYQNEMTVEDVEMPPSADRQRHKSWNLLANRFCFWGALIVVAYLILVFSFVGILYAVVRLASKTMLTDEDLVLNPRTGRPLRVAEPMSFAPLPLLWALPLEYFQEVPSVVLQMSSREREMFRVNSVHRDLDQHLTTFTLPSGYSLLISPDIGVLQGPEGRVAAKWNFNVIWRQMYQQQRLDETLSSDVNEEEEFLTIWHNIQETYRRIRKENQQVLQEDMIANQVQTAGDVPPSSSILSPEQQPGATPVRFPIFRRRPGGSTNGTLSGTPGFPTPESAFSLPASLISPDEFAVDARKQLHGFPVPMVDENEPIQFTATTPMHRTSSNSSESITESIRTTDHHLSPENEGIQPVARRSLMLSMEELFSFKMGLLGSGIEKTARKFDMLAGMGGAFLSPAVNWAMSSPTSGLMAPLISSFSQYSPSAYSGGLLNDMLYHGPLGSPMLGGYY